MPVIVGFPSGGGSSDGIAVPLPSITASFVVNGGGDLGGPVKELPVQLPNMSFVGSVAAQ